MHSRHAGDLAYLAPRVAEMRRVLGSEGTLYFHTSPHRSHFYKVFLLDPLFGRAAFLNEVIWILGAEEVAIAGRRWPESHSVILVYAKDPRHTYFDLEGVERIPYMAPGLVGPKKRQKGKLPTDTWWRSQLNSSLLEMILPAATPPGSCVLDPFAGEGATGLVCRKLNRQFILIENDPGGVQALKHAFAGLPVEWHSCVPVEEQGSDRV